jgi:hypothetical protein
LLVYIVDKKEKVFTLQIDTANTGCFTAEIHSQRLPGMQSATHCYWQGKSTARYTGYAAGGEVLKLVRIKSPRK